MSFRLASNAFNYKPFFVDSRTFLYKVLQEEPTKMMVLVANVSTLNHMFQLHPGFWSLAWCWSSLQRWRSQIPPYFDSDTVVRQKSSCNTSPYIDMSLSLSHDYLCTYTYISLYPSIYTLYIYIYTHIDCSSDHITVPRIDFLHVGNFRQLPFDLRTHHSTHLFAMVPFKG